VINFFCYSCDGYLGAAFVCFSMLLLSPAYCFLSCYLFVDFSPNFFCAQVDSFRFGSIVYVLVRRTNKFGNFLELSEYGENGRRSFVIIPEGEEGKGWIDCREQLSKLKQHHDKQKMGEPLTGGRAGKIVAGANGLIKGQREISTANTSLQGAHKSYAEVLQGKGQNLNLNPKQDSNFEFESQAIGKPLKDVLSGDLEQAEKITGEQVDFLTFRDLLSDFKRDLIQCIESYMAGWTPPNAEANRARKGVSNGRPKVSMEKPKVQYTYFRKIKGLDLQLGPGIDMGQSWGTLVGVPQVGGVGSESVSVFSRLGGNELSIVDELCPDISDMAFKPLNIIIPCAAIESEFPDWVIKCAERIHSRVGVSYVGQKWQFMALLTFLEKERLKEIQFLSASKRNREVKNLKSSINYDFRGEGQSSRGKRKGRGSDVV
jgi:hypothetical protein